ncbi:MAG: hypothetical protein IKV01_00310 [Clostridia bacterium]|nr:hypothetical protein [Clostridia bacterium]
MKTTKRIICIFLALTFALLVGCKDNSLSAVSLPVDKVVAETDGHILFYSGEDCYLKFFDPGHEPYGCGSAGITFESLDDFRTRLLEGDFSETEKWELQLNKCDESGNMKIFDFENMYQLASREQLSLSVVTWFGTPSYICKYKKENSALRVFFTYYESKEYEEKYNERYVDFFASLNEKYTVSKGDNPNKTEYRSDRDMYICYDIEDNGRTIKAKEFYWIDNIHGYPNSDTVPYYIHMYITEGETNYVISIEEVSYSFTEHPGEEWLLSFGMEPYVPAGE